MNLDRDKNGIFAVLIISRESCYNDFASSYFTFCFKNDTMKLLFALVFATIFAATVALNDNPLTTIPYCAPVTNGLISIPEVTFNYTDYYCKFEEFESDFYSWAPAFAIFLNGEDTGFDLAYYVDDDGYANFWSPDYNTNGTYLTPPSAGVVWDVGTDSCEGGYGINDGTYDTVDGAMSFVFGTESGFEMYGENAEITTTCSSGNTVSLSLGADVLPNGLTMKKTFYFPAGMRLPKIVPKQRFKIYF